jgi:hypothetical protein
MFPDRLRLFEITPDINIVRLFVGEEVRGEVRVQLKLFPTYLKITIDFHRI